MNGCFELKFSVRITTAHLHDTLLCPLPKLHVLTKQKPGVEGRLQTVAADYEPALHHGCFDGARALCVVLPGGEYALQMQDFSEGVGVGEMGNEGCGGWDDNSDHCCNNNKTNK